QLVRHAKSWRSASATACRDLPTNERKRETSLPYARCVLGLRPCSHSFSNCSSLLACRLVAGVILHSSTALGECRIMCLLTHSDYRKSREATRKYGVIIRYKSS